MEKFHHSPSENEQESIDLSPSPQSHFSKWKKIKMCLCVSIFLIVIGTLAVVLQRGPSKEAEKLNTDELKAKL